MFLKKGKLKSILQSRAQESLKEGIMEVLDDTIVISIPFFSLGFNGFSCEYKFHPTTKIVTEMTLEANIYRLDMEDKVWSYNLQWVEVFSIKTTHKECLIYEISIKTPPKRTYDGLTVTQSEDIDNNIVYEWDGKKITHYRDFDGNFYRDVWGVEFPFLSPAENLERFLDSGHLTTRITW